MPRHAIKYSDEMLNTPEGTYLYGLWQRMRRGGREKYFDSYHNFYKWAMAQGYKFGALIRRIDESRMWSRRNCEVYIPKGERHLRGDDCREFISRWNRSVNRFRVRLGLKPFPVEVEYDG